MNTHQWIQEELHRAPKHVARELAVQLLNNYTHQTRSRTAWNKVPAFQIRWTRQAVNRDGLPAQPEESQSIDLTLSMLEHLLDESGTFHFGSLGLPDPRCDWLDAVIDVAPSFHAPSVDGQSALTIVAPTPLGNSYPFHPSLDREGLFFNSFQALLLRRIGSVRRNLITASAGANTESWFQDFRTLISECVSLIDTTLHQLYFKAQYSSLKGWKFEPDRLGPRHGQRLVDKLNWVHKITGQHLNASVHVARFTKLKDLRNHLQHFDPPSFSYSVEDAVPWLNHVLDCGHLNWAIRRCVGSPLSVPLIELLLQRPVHFVPSDPSRPRIPQKEDVGYGSTDPARVAARLASSGPAGSARSYDVPPDATMGIRRI